MSTRHHILSRLADGKFHSGTELGAQLGISRAAVNKSVQSLVDRGLEIHSVSGKGYCWNSPSVLLDQNRLIQALQPVMSSHQLSLTLLDEVESTSSYLVEKLAQGMTGPEVCVTENQISGRGRRGRSWSANPYQNIALSIAWKYEFGPSKTSGLSIAAGVAVMRALQRLGITGASLKWPNDILHNQRKLAGLLVDLRGEADGPTDLILGIGLNVRLGSHAARQVDQPWTDLETVYKKRFDRNDIVVELVRELVAMFLEFGNSGLATYRDDWSKWHSYEGQQVRLLQADGELTGTARGIDETGALLLDVEGNVITVHSGEVSLRAC